MLETMDFEEWFEVHKSELALLYYGKAPVDLKDDIFIKFCEGRFNEERDEL